MLQGNSRLMQNPPGAAFARKMLSYEVRDEGRMPALFDESCNEADARKPFKGAALRAVRRAASFGDGRAIRLQLAPCIQSRNVTPRPPWVLRQAASLRLLLGGRT